MRAGGPNEIVPEAHKQRNIQVAMSFLRSLGGANALNISQTFIAGQIPIIPTLVPGMIADVLLDKIG